MPIGTPPIIVSKNNEFFIALGKKGIHSFLMLGVIKNGIPQLLTRVGKFGLKVSIAEVLAKSLYNGLLSRIEEESIYLNKSNIPIQYQAYSITYEQTKEFLSLIAEVERRQIQNPAINEALIKNCKNPKTKERILNKRINSYVPFNTDYDDEIVFEWNELQGCYEFEGCDLEQLAENKYSTSILNSSQYLDESNTCRTTSLNIIEALLGFVTGISKYFFIAPKYQTTLVDGQPNKDTFYVMPPPPIAYVLPASPKGEKKEYSPKQLQILDKLYQQMEKMPFLSPDSPATRAKFNALKATYLDIAGTNKLSAGHLMLAITEHIKTKGDALFTHRKPNFFSNLFSLSSSTQKLFNEITSDLQTEVGKEEKQKLDTNKNQSPQ